jgi:hypothetical protein
MTATARNARNQFPKAIKLAGGKIKALHKLQWIACSELIKIVKWD